MKRISIIGFRGLGTGDADYTREHALIFTGHVGIAFEDDIDIIYGFRPTEAEIERVGGMEQAIKKLKNHKANDTLEGRLYNDYVHFERAAALAEQRRASIDRNTTVFQFSIEVADQEYAQIRRLVLEWYKKEKIFTYGFPIKSFPPDRDNCGSFMRKLGINLNGIGDMIEYINVLKVQKTVWTPKGTRNATERDLE